MKVLITTFGTRGDIQPFIALGKGLKAAGYDVAICTPEGFRGFVEEHGLHYLFMDNELLKLTQDALGDITAREGMSIVKQMAPAIRRSMDDEWRAAQTFQPDLILYHPKCMGSYHIAEKLNIPVVMSIPLPFYTPTSEFPVPFMANVRLGGWFNRLSYSLIIGPASAMYGGTVNDFRTKTLGLAPISRSKNLLVRSDNTSVPVLYPYSQHVLPVPKDFPPHVHVTGYWFLDQSTDWQPPADLVRFLDAGSLPVYIGFGSVGGRNAEKRTQVVIEALNKSGQRGVLASGWSGFKASSLPPNIILLDSVPHDWLFPRVAAVVHHGGAGTTAAGLRAGKPTIICPFIADQPFWGQRVFELGVGTKPIPQKKLTADNLAEGICAALTDSEMRQRAENLGGRIRGEDGVGNAVEIINRNLDN